MQFLLIILGLSLAVGQQVRYDGYKVFQIIPRDQQQVELLSKLQRTKEYDFWLGAGAPNKEALVMVPPEKIGQLDEFLMANGISSRVRTENVQDSIDSDQLNRAQAGDSMDWNKFHTLKTIYDWLDALPNKYPFVRTVVAGSSYQNRTIKGIEINFGNNLTGVVILSGIHGRDWLAPAGTSWFVNKILQTPKDSIFQKFNYLYFPIMNPDSYVYTWKKDRYWMKTRKPYKQDGETYYGADPDRNFDFHWRKWSEPDYQDYSGPYAFSEVETMSLRKYLKSVECTRRNDIYLTFQAVGSALLHPWGWTKNLPKQHKFWQNVSVPAAKAWHSVDGTSVDIGTLASDEPELIWGNSLDWIYGRFNCTFPFLYKMSGDDYVVPNSLIVVSGREHLVSLKALLKQYKKVKPTAEV